MNRRKNNELNYGVLPELLGYHIRLAQVATFRDFELNLKSLELTPTLFGSLVLIEANPGMKQTDLAHAVQLDRSTVVSVVDRLEGRGLVERKRASDDRRSNALFVTASGKKLIKKAIPLVVEHEQKLFEFLDERSRSQFTSVLQRIFNPQK